MFLYCQSSISCIIAHDVTENANKNIELMQSKKNYTSRIAVSLICYAYWLIYSEIQDVLCQLGLTIAKFMTMFDVSITKLRVSL